MHELFSEKAKRQNKPFKHFVNTGATAPTINKHIGPRTYPCRTLRSEFPQLGGKSQKQVFTTVTNRTRHSAVSRQKHDTRTTHEQRYVSSSSVTTTHHPYTPLTERYISVLTFWPAFTASFAASFAAFFAFFLAAFAAAVAAAAASSSSIASGDDVIADAARRLMGSATALSAPTFCPPLSFWRPSRDPSIDISPAASCILRT